MGVTARAYRVDVLDADGVNANADRIVADFGRIDVLLNSAGGNLKSAITGPGTGFFDLAPQAIQDTMSLNFMGGAVLPCLFHGARMVANDTGGAIINISSMNAVRPLEGRPAYAASKAAVSNFTQWLACHVARHYTPLIRVNAIAPGFFPNSECAQACSTMTAATTRGRAGSSTTRPWVGSAASTTWWVPRCGTRATLRGSSPARSRRSTADSAPTAA